jgi:hypothetical protein
MDNLSITKILQAIKTDNLDDFSRETQALTTNYNFRVNANSVANSYINQVQQLCHRHSAINCLNHLNEASHGFKTFEDLLIASLFSCDIDAIELFTSGELPYSTPKLLLSLSNSSRTLGPSEIDFLDQLIMRKPQPWIDVISSSGDDTYASDILYTFKAESKSALESIPFHSIHILLPLIKHHADKLDHVTPDGLYALTLAGLIGGEYSNVMHIWHINKEIFTQKSYKNITTLGYGLFNYHSITYTPRTILIACANLEIPSQAIVSVCQHINYILNSEDELSAKIKKDTSSKDFIKYPWAQTNFINRLDAFSHPISAVYEAGEVVDIITSDHWINGEHELRNFCARLGESETVSEHLLSDIKRLLANKLSDTHGSLFNAYYELVNLIELLPNKNSKDRINIVSALSTNKHQRLALFLLKSIPIEDFFKDKLSARNVHLILNFYQVAPLEMISKFTNKSTQTNLLTCMS